MLNTNRRAGFNVSRLKKHWIVVGDGIKNKGDRQRNIANHSGHQ